MPERDNILLERIRTSDDQKAFEYLYHLYYFHLCNYALGFVKKPADAQDLVNDCFYELWKNRGNLVIKTSLKGWLFVNIRNKSINHLKKTKAGLRYISEQSYPFAFEQEITGQTELLVMQDELEDQLKKAIDQLPDQCRYIFYLNRFEGMKYREIAEKLHLSEATVKTQIARALKSLRCKLESFRSLVLLFFTMKKG